MPSIPVGGPERTFDSRVEEIVRRIVRQEAARLVGAQPAEADAQSTGGGLGIQNIRRGLLFESASAGNTALTVGSSWLSLTYPVTGEIYLSGRPLLLLLKVLVEGAGGGYGHASVTLRGTEVTGSANGMTYQGPSLIGSQVGLWVVESPLAGLAKLEVVGRAGGAGATLYQTAADPIHLIAVEL